MKKLILCDLDTAENNYNYDCNRSDNCSDYEDPCQNCCHRCHKEIEILDTEGKTMNIQKEIKKIQRQNRIIWCFDFIMLIELIIAAIVIF